MDHSDTLDAGMSTAGLTLNKQDVNNLLTAGKWGRFISIVGFVMIGLAILFLLAFGGTMFALLGTSEMGGAGLVGGTFIAVIYGITFAISLYLYYLLYRFSTKAIAAARSGDGFAMSESFVALKTMLKISGILLAIVLGFYVLGIVFAVIGGAMTML